MSDDTVYSHQIKNIVPTFISTKNDVTIPIFIVDSGASRIMINQKAAFCSLRPDKTPISLANGSVIYSAGIGSVGPFNNVYYVPKLTKNLLSVSYLNEMNFSVTFHPNKSISLIDSTGNSIIIGRQSGNLYQTNSSLMNISKQTDHTYCLTATHSSYSDIIHKRTCHINDHYIHSALVNKLVTGINCIRYQPTSVCDACRLAKATKHATTKTPGSAHRHITQTKSPLSTSPSVAPTNSTSLLHRILPNDIITSLVKFSVDLKGPLPVSLNKYRYVMLFTSNVNRYRVAYLLKSKDETLHKFQQFISHIKHIGITANSIIQQGLNNSDTSLFDTTPVKEFLHTSKIDFKFIPFSEIKSDNGTEFVNEDVQELFLHNNIHHERTSPYSPHQNAIAERSNRTVFELAAAIMYDSNAPLMLWEYAINTVIYVLNLMPNKVLGLKSTPYLNMFGHPADLSHLRVFGCDAYLLLPEHKRPAFGLRAIKGIFVGYDSNSLSYLIYYNRKVYKSKDVTFNEDLSSRIKDNNELIQDLLQFIESNPPNIPLQQPPSEPTQDSEPITSSSSSSTSTSEPPPNTSESSNSSSSTLSSEIGISIILPDITSSTTTAPTSTTYNTRGNKVEAVFYTDTYTLIDNAMSASTSGNYYDHRYAHIDIHTALLAGDNISYEEAIHSPEAAQWKAAMILEIKRLFEIDTFEVIDSLPPHRKALNYLWVLKKIGYVSR